MEKEALRKIVLNFLRFGGSDKYMLDRDFDAFFSDGYDDPRFRTCFFCFKGSPNKIYGWMHYKLDNTIILEGVCNKGKFYTDEKHIWRQKGPKPKNATPLVDY